MYRSSSKILNDYVLFSSEVIQVNKHTQLLLLPVYCLSAFLLDSKQQIMVDPKPILGSLGVMKGYILDETRMSCYFEKQRVLLVRDFSA